MANCEILFRAVKFSLSAEESAHAEKNADKIKIANDNALDLLIVFLPRRGYSSNPSLGGRPS